MKEEKPLVQEEDATGEAVEEDGELELIMLLEMMRGEDGGDAMMVLKLWGG